MALLFLLLLAARIRSSKAQFDLPSDWAPPENSGKPGKPDMWDAPDESALAYMTSQQVFDTIDVMTPEAIEYRRNRIKNRRVAWLQERWDWLDRREREFGLGGGVRRRKRLRERRRDRSRRRLLPAEADDGARELAEDTKAEDTRAEDTRAEDIKSEDTSPRVLLGIMTMLEEAAGREMVRKTWAAPERLPAGFILRFFMCDRAAESGGDGDAPLTAERLPAADAAAGDVLLLPCRENMNEGKMLAYWRSVAAPGGLISSLKLDFVCKGDMDTFILADELLADIVNLPRHGLVGGARKLTPVAPHTQSKVPAFAVGRISYMAGQFYVLSADLARWVADSEAAAQRPDGPEDVMLGWWLHDGLYLHRGRLTYDWGHLDPCRPWVHRSFFQSEAAARAYLGEPFDPALLEEGMGLYTNVEAYPQILAFIDKTRERRRAFCPAPYLAETL